MRELSGIKWSLLSLSLSLLPSPSLKRPEAPPYQAILAPIHLQRTQYVQPQAGYLSAILVIAIVINFPQYFFICFKFLTPVP